MASGTPMSSVTRLDSDGDSGSFIEFELAIQVGRCDGWRSGGQADAVEVGDDRARLGESGDDTMRMGTGRSPGSAGNSSASAFGPPVEIPIPITSRGKSGINVSVTFGIAGDAGLDVVLSGRASDVETGLLGDVDPVRVPRSSRRV